MKPPAAADSSLARMAEIEPLFHEALGLPAETRSDFLAERVPDPVLRCEIEKLLQADTRGSDFLVAPALGTDFVLGEPEELAQAGPAGRVGPYELVRLVGSGGIAHIWLARRTDGEFRKDVAVKLIKRGLDTDAILARFRQERQVLARLEHPHIARLIDGGATEDGLPYLVMEYVDGVPIDRYCHDRGLGVEARLHLFLDVCAAVQYAHQNLVIHRDLKPGNILVADVGTVSDRETESTTRPSRSETAPTAQPKLLDFGIAKVLGSEDTGYTVTTTRPDNRLLTPGYASPEQIRGGPVTTASDVYSLGVVLYELLTTQRPHVSASDTELQQMVREQEPLRPSTRVLRVACGSAGSPAAWPEGDPLKLAKRLRGDLDAILLKALHKEPSGRYASVEQLAEDVRRHLARLPVQARVPTVIYRARRFVGRNLVAVSASVAFVLLLVAAATTSTVFYFRADRALRAETDQREKAQLAQQRAERETRKYAAIDEFIGGILAPADPAVQGGRDDVTVREALDAASQRLLSGEVKYDPEVEADVRMKMGGIYRDVGLAEPALAHFNAALELRRKVLGPEHLAVASSLNDVGRALRDLRRWPEAEHTQREGLRIRRKQLGDDHPDVADSLQSLGMTLRRMRKFDELDSLYAEALEIYRKKHGEEHEEYARCLESYGVTLHYMNRLVESEACHRRAYEIKRKLFGDKTEKNLADSVHNLSTVLWDLGRKDESIAFGEEAVRMATRLHGQRHPEVANVQRMLASNYFNVGRLEEAEALLREVVTTYREIFGPQHYDAVVALWSIAQTLNKMDRWQEAESAYQEAIPMMQALNPHDNRTYEMTMSRGVVLQKQGRFPEAETAFVDALVGIRSAAPTMCEENALKRLEQLYEVWDAAAACPEIASAAAVWREELSLPSPPPPESGVLPFTERR